MSITQKIRDFIASFNRVDSMMDSANYWQYHQHENALSWLSAGPEYDGKFKFQRTHEEIKEIEARLLPYVENGSLIGFKYKSDKTPMDLKYAGQLPPVFVYCKNKGKPQTAAILHSEGIHDMIWIDDNRSALELEAAHYNFL